MEGEASNATRLFCQKSSILVYLPCCLNHAILNNESSKKGYQYNLNATHSTQILFEPLDNSRLSILCGQQNENIRHLEQHFDVVIHNRANQFEISGQQHKVDEAIDLLNILYHETEHINYLPLAKIHLFLHDRTNKQDKKLKEDDVTIKTKSGLIRGYTKNQREYLKNIQQYDINFAIGPAGTGKTYLAVASAVDALSKNLIQRILLVRPAVEAGEKLGFLPGGLEEKIEPYLRPLYDALFEMLGFEQVEKLISKNVIEVAPLAYMRGRTLNDSYVILDESQNTTLEQMKMFLTRIGFGSHAIITGDITQIDLPKGKKSGLIHACEVLKDINEICFSYFDSKDVVRHELVQKIIEAYDKHDRTQD